MATTKKSKTKARAKTKSRAKSGTKTKRKTKARVKRKKSSRTSTSRRKKTAVPEIDLTADDKAAALEVKGERLLVKLSRDQHPEVFEIDKLLKQVQKVRESNKNKRKLRDLTEFLVETEKSLQIILSNHLEDALRKYLR